MGAQAAIQAQFNAHTCKPQAAPQPAVVTVKKAKAKTTKK